MENILAAYEFQTLWYRRKYKSSLLLLPNFSCQMICHLLLFMKLFPKKLPYLFYAIKEGKKENSWPGGQWNAVSRNNTKLEMGYIFFWEDMRKTHLYCVLSLNSDLWFITFVIRHTCIHSEKCNEFSVIQRHRSQNFNEHI